MRANLLDSPRGLAALTCLGGLVSALGFACFQGFRSLIPVVLAFGVIVFGSIVMFKAGYDLREGIRNERWPEAEIVPLRRMVQHPVWIACIVTLLVAMCAALLTARSHHRYFWAVFLLLQITTQLSNAISRPYEPPGVGGHIDWTKISPLHSEHWGER